MVQALVIDGVSILIIVYGTFVRATAILIRTEWGGVLTTLLFVERPEVQWLVGLVKSVDRGDRLPEKIE